MPPQTEMNTPRIVVLTKQKLTIVFDVPTINCSPTPFCLLTLASSPPDKLRGRLHEAGWPG